MKVTVTKFLNVRVGKPGVNAPCYNYLAPGSIIDVEDVLVNGDAIDGNNKWFKGLDGSYYWSGGTSYTDIKNRISSLPGFNYNQAVSVPKAWKDSKGEGITIAVLDSGVFAAHPDLAGKLSPEKIKDASFSDNGAVDTFGHGTHCAGLIAGSSASANGITGVAPGAGLYIVKVQHENFGVTETRLANGINYAIQAGVDIINLSLQVNNPNDPNLKSAFEKARDLGIVIVAAAGENTDILSDRPSFYYPAMYSECLAVGAIDPAYSGSSFNKKLDFVVPFAELLSCDIQANSLYSKRRGSSMAAALVSGAAALLLSSGKFKKERGMPEKLREELKAGLPGIQDIKFDTEKAISIVKP